MRTCVRPRLQSIVVVIPLLALAVMPGAEAATSSSPVINAATTEEATYYIVEDLGVLPGDTTSVAMAINELGQVVGTSSHSASHRAFVYTDGVGMVELPGLPDRPNTYANDINDAGQVVGRADAGGTDLGHAVLWTGGVIKDLGVLGDESDFSEALGINEAGHVVGFSTTSGTGGRHPFLYTPEAGMVDLTPGEGGYLYSAVAYDINESGQVAGYRNNLAFRWENGQFLNLGVLPDFAYSFGHAINDHGQVAGSSSIAQGDVSHVVRYTDGVGLEDLGGISNRDRAWGINNHGTVVGEARLNGVQRGFVSFGQGLIPLDELIDQSLGWGILVARDINDAGQIAATAYNNITGQTHAVRLQPTSAPPPACSFQCLRVSDIELSAKAKSRGSVVTVTAKIRVADEDGRPLSNAYVLGRWTLPGGETSSFNLFTDKWGVATTQQSAGPGTYVVTVDNVILSQYTFDPDNSVLTKSITR